MKIYTSANSQTISKLAEAYKSKVEKNMFLPGPILVDVNFTHYEYVESDPFFLDGNVIIAKRSGFKIDFLIKPYTEMDDVFEIADEVAKCFSAFIQQCRFSGLVLDSSIVKCFDGILFNNRYVGKNVLAQGIEEKPNGEIFIFSHNYAESLITQKHSNT